MGSLFSDKYIAGTLQITQLTGTATDKAIAGIDQLLLILPKRVPAALWRKIPQGSTLQSLLRRKSDDDLPAVSIHLANKRHTTLHAASFDAKSSAFDALTFARKMVTAAATGKSETLGIWVLGFTDEEQKSLVARVTAAALAAGFAMPQFKSKAAPAPLKNIRILGCAERIDLSRVSAEAEGNNLARWLTALPPNKLDAVNYVKFLKELASQEGWQFRKYSVRELEKMGAGAFLAVAQGNENNSAAIVHIRYRPGAKTAAPKLSLVGKGIIFDTGGTNLKPFSSMLDMHTDMGGSAVAVGSLLTISRLGLSQPVDCWLAITENRTGPTAYKSQDVITALNGKTIQSIHTDAEGRLVLADTLTLAAADKPKLILDFATLTGACVNAVTDRYSGVFTNRPELHPVLKRSGEECGERVWPFPIGKEFLDDLKSDTADIQQCSANASGDHILAASFLQEFVDDRVPWVHIDLSACTRKGGLAHVPTEITGFGVRFTMHLIIDKKLITNSA